MQLNVRIVPSSGNVIEQQTDLARGLKISPTKAMLVQ